MGISFVFHTQGSKSLYSGIIDGLWVLSSKRNVEFWLWAELGLWGKRGSCAILGHSIVSNSVSPWTIAHQAIFLQRQVFPSKMTKSFGKVGISDFLFYPSHVNLCLPPNTNIQEFFKNAEIAVICEIHFKTLFNP